MGFIFAISIVAPGIGQESFTRAQIDSLIQERWNFYLIRDLYGKYTGDKMIKVIRRCYPHEIDTLVSIGSSIMKTERWNNATGWFELSLRNAPNHLPANYGYAICKREMGHNMAVLGRTSEWKAAQKHFECIIDLDSTYLDVFYQYALLEYYRENYSKSIGLAHRQLAANPLAYSGQIGIFRLYYYVIGRMPEEEAEALLKSRYTKYDTYFLGELYRFQNDYTRADSVFRRILDELEDFPVQPVYVSLVKMHIQCNELDKAEETYWKAVDSITNRLEADLLLEDFMYIVNEKEYDLLRGDLSLESLPRTLRIFWLRRNPLPSMPNNSRLIEHYRRIIYSENEFIYDGFRHRKYKADVSYEFRFPPYYYENYRFNDMGLIYIRFGDPDDRAFARARNAVAGDLGRHFYDSIPPNMSWLYYEHDDQQSMIFHFYLPEGAPPGYWTLVPGFGMWEIMESISTWPISATEDYTLARVADVDRAMQNDRHTWPKEIEALDVDYSTARFRETKKHDLVQLAYAIPISNLRDGGGEENDIYLEVGVAVLGSNADTLFQEVRNITLEDVSDDRIWNDLFIDEIELPLALERYNVSMHTRIPETHKLNGWRWICEPGDLVRDRLACSTLKLGFDIRPTSDKDRRDRKALRIIPNPTKTFDRKEPVFVYYEIYNLTFSDRMVTDYTINFVLRKAGKKGIVKKIKGLFGSGQEYQISVESSQSSVDRTVTDYISFDMSKARKGKYELTLEIRDNVSGEETSVVADLVLR
jgi:tetratricopeptide (TPR) repeat protein